MGQHDQSVEQAVAPFIDGALVQSAGDDVIAVVDPSTGREVMSIPAGCHADAERAVGAARRAFEDGRWSETAPSVRKGILHRFADLIAQEGKELDALDAGEMGKPISERTSDAAGAARVVRFHAEAVDKVLGDVYGSDINSLVLQRRVPRGVVAAITPWNFPTFAAAVKLGPALAAGNCVILKPSEWSSRSAIRLAQLASRAGLPAGVLNVVPGAGQRVGQALALHGDVDMVTFTGSTAVGRSLLQHAGQSNMKTVLAECGGKSPHIVFADGVDLEFVGGAIARMLLTNQGQICSVGSRLLVQRSGERLLLDRIVGELRRIVMGNALDPKTTFGPLVSARQLSRVMEYIDGAAGEGAELVTGGHRVLQQSGGNFVEPTVFRNVPPAARIAQEEIFGPVLAVTPFDDEEEAVRIANGTMYGLMAYVWTADLSTGLRMAKKVRSSIRINTGAPVGEGAGPAQSHEPAGQSGFGVEGGVAGLESYLRRQRVWFSHA